MLSYSFTVNLNQKAEKWLPHLLTQQVDFDELKMKGFSVLISQSYVYFQDKVTFKYAKFLL